MSAIRQIFTYAVISILTISYGLTAQTSKNTSEGISKKAPKPLITFVELGSVNCIPCKKMQPVMKAIEEKYGGAVQVVFHDVMKDEGKPAAKKYNIRLIPTQVFLDAKGKEFHRHEGFYPEEEIHKILQKKGLKPRA